MDIISERQEELMLKIDPDEIMLKIDPDEIMKIECITKRKGYTVILQALDDDGHVVFCLDKISRINLRYQKENP